MTARDCSIHGPLTGQHLTFTETDAETDGTSLRAVVRLECDAFVPLHLHLRRDERLEVLTGSIRLRTAGTKRVLNACDSGDVTGRRLQAFANAGSGEASFVLEGHPARSIETTIRSTFAAGRVPHPSARLSAEVVPTKFIGWAARKSDGRSSWREAPRRLKAAPAATSVAVSLRGRPTEREGTDP